MELFLIWIFTILGSLAQNNSNFNLQIGFLFLTLLVTYYVINWHKRRKKAGTILLTLAQNNRFYFCFVFLGLAIIILNAIIFAFLFIFKKENEIFVYYFLICFIQSIMGIGVIWIGFSLKNIEIRQQGICHGLTVFKWKQIKSYQWKKNILYLRIKSTWIPIKSLNFQVIATNRERVEQLLINFLSTKSNH